MIWNCFRASTPRLGPPTRGTTVYIMRRHVPVLYVYGEKLKTYKARVAEAVGVHPKDIVLRRHSRVLENVTLAYLNGDKHPEINVYF